MPIHDWSQIPAGLFHDFHQGWTVRIAQELNAGLLPEGLSALLERRVATKVIPRSTAHCYSVRANRIVIRHQLARAVAVIETVSPGNKESRAGLRECVDTTIDFIREGVHVLVIDLFPPTPRDPFGIHKLIWDEIHEEDFAFPKGKDRTLVSYETGGDRAAYIEPVAVGDELPDMPLLLTNDVWVMVPLEPTYMTTWNATHEVMRIAVETGEMPEGDEE